MLPHALNRPRRRLATLSGIVHAANESFTAAAGPESAHVASARRQLCLVGAELANTAMAIWRADLGHHTLTVPLRNPPPASELALSRRLRALTGDLLALQRLGRALRREGSPSVHAASSTRSAGALIVWSQRDCDLLPLAFPVLLTRVRALQGPGVLHDVVRGLMHARLECAAGGGGGTGTTAATTRGVVVTTPASVVAALCTAVVVNGSEDARRPMSSLADESKLGEPRRKRARTSTTTTTTTTMKTSASASAGDARDAVPNSRAASSRDAPAAAPAPAWKDELDQVLFAVIEAAVSAQQQARPDDSWGVPGDMWVADGGEAAADGGGAAPRLRLATTSATVVASRTDAVLLALARISHDAALHVLATLAGTRSRGADVSRSMTTSPGGSSAVLVPGETCVRAALAIAARELPEGQQGQGKLIDLLLAAMPTCATQGVSPTPVSTTTTASFERRSMRPRRLWQFIAAHQHQRQQMMMAPTGRAREKLGMWEEAVGVIRAVKARLLACARLRLAGTAATTRASQRRDGVRLLRAYLALVLYGGVRLDKDASKAVADLIRKVVSGLAEPEPVQGQDDIEDPTIRVSPLMYSAGYAMRLCIALAFFAGCSSCAGSDGGGNRDGVEEDGIGTMPPPPPVAHWQALLKDLLVAHQQHRRNAAVTTVDLSRGAAVQLACSGAASHTTIVALCLSLASLNAAAAASATTQPKSFSSSTAVIKGEDSQKDGNYHNVSSGAGSNGTGHGVGTKGNEGEAPAIGSHSSSAISASPKVESTRQVASRDWSAVTMTMVAHLALPAHASCRLNVAKPPVGTRAEASSPWAAQAIPPPPMTRLLSADHACMPRFWAAGMRTFAISVLARVYQHGPVRTAATLAACLTATTVDPPLLRAIQAQAQAQAQAVTTTRPGASSALAEDGKLSRRVDNVELMTSMDLICDALAAMLSVPVPPPLPGPGPEPDIRFQQLTESSFAMLCWTSCVAAAALASPSYSKSHTRSAPTTSVPVRTLRLLFLLAARAHGIEDKDAAGQGEPQLAKSRCSPMRVRGSIPPLALARALLAIVKGPRSAPGKAALPATASPLALIYLLLIRAHIRNKAEGGRRVAHRSNADAVSSSRVLLPVLRSSAHPGYPCPHARWMAPLRLPPTPPLWPDPSPWAQADGQRRGASKNGEDEDSRMDVDKKEPPPEEKQSPKPGPPKARTVQECCAAWDALATHNHRTRRQPGVCFDWQNKNGGCRRGERCRFSHCACDSNNCTCTRNKNTLGIVPGADLNPFMDPQEDKMMDMVLPPPSSSFEGGHAEGRRTSEAAPDRAERNGAPSSASASGMVKLEGASPSTGDRRAMVLGVYDSTSFRACLASAKQEILLGTSLTSKSRPGRKLSGVRPLHGVSESARALGAADFASLAHRALAALRPKSVDTRSNAKERGLRRWLHSVLAALLARDAVATGNVGLLLPRYVSPAVQHRDANADAILSLPSAHTSAAASQPGQAEVTTAATALKEAAASARVVPASAAVLGNASKALRVLLAASAASTSQRGTGPGSGASTSAAVLRVAVPALRDTLAVVQEAMHTCPEAAHKIWGLVSNFCVQVLDVVATATLIEDLTHEDAATALPSWALAGSAAAVEHAWRAAVVGLLLDAFASGRSNFGSAHFGAADQDVAAALAWSRRTWVSLIHGPHLPLFAAQLVLQRVHLARTITAAPEPAPASGNAQESQSMSTCSCHHGPLLSFLFDTARAAIAQLEGVLLPAALRRWRQQRQQQLPTSSRSSLAVSVELETRRKMLASTAAVTRAATAQATLRLLDFHLRLSPKTVHQGRAPRWAQAWRSGLRLARTLLPLPIVRLSTESHLHTAFGSGAATRASEMSCVVRVGLERVVRSGAPTSSMPRFQCEVHDGNPDPGGAHSHSLPCLRGGSLPPHLAAATVIRIGTGKEKRWGRGRRQTDGHSEAAVELRLVLRANTGPHLCLGMRRVNFTLALPPSQATVVAGGVRLELTAEYVELAPLDGATLPVLPADVHQLHRNDSRRRPPSRDRKSSDAGDAASDFQLFSASLSLPVTCTTVKVRVPIVPRGRGASKKDALPRALLFVLPARASIEATSAADEKAISTATLKELLVHGIDDGQAGGVEMTHLVQLCRALACSVPAVAACLPCAALEGSLMRLASRFRGQAFDALHSALDFDWRFVLAMLGAITERYGETLPGADTRVLDVTVEQKSQPCAPARVSTVATAVFSSAIAAAVALRRDADVWLPTHVPLCASDRRLAVLLIKAVIHVLPLLLAPGALPRLRPLAVDLLMTLRAASMSMGQQKEEAGILNLLPSGDGDVVSARRAFRAVQAAAAAAFDGAAFS